MSNLLLISDANILIDIVDGEIVDQFFELDYEYAVPDVLYREELAQTHSGLIDKGLLVKELTNNPFKPRYSKILLNRRALHILNISP